MMVAAHSDWPRAGLLWLGFVLLVILSMWPTAVSMVDIWWNLGTYNHAFAVPLIVGWLAWGRREVWLPLRPRADYRWWPLLLCASLLVLVGEAALANAPAHVGLVALLVLSVPSLLGSAIARALIFPLGYAFFMVPVGDFLLPQMMEATATFTVMALRATGIPVYREGLMFVIPSGQWSVVEACSGVRYLIASLSVGTLYAYISYRSWRRRLAFVGLALLVPIVANWLRAYFIVLLGHFSDNRLATGADHLVYGWVFFGVVMALLFLIGGRWVDAGFDEWKRKGMLKVGSSEQRVTEPLGAVRSPGSGWMTAAACAALACSPAIASVWLQHSGDSLADVRLPEVAQWSGPVSVDTDAAPWKPRYLAPDSERMALYAGIESSASVGVYQAEYRNQDRGRKLLNSENVLVANGHERWQILAHSAGPVQVATPRGTLVLPTQWVAERALASNHAPARLLAVRLVQVDGQWMVTSPRARLAMAWARLRGRPDQAIGWVVYTPVDVQTSGLQDAEAAASRRLAEFLSAALIATSR